MKKSKEEWKEHLTESQYHILREKDTELPFTGRLLREKRSGVFVCGGCGQKLFSSDTKFESGSGWPSFYDVVSKRAVKLKEDSTLGIKRVEVVCSKCGGHLGHLFEDGPQDKTGKRYCINSGALEFKEKK
jgi:peptide-methionine (R)-S-oxide reductase